MHNIVTIGARTLAAVLLFSSYSLGIASSQKPNILFIIYDDLSVPAVDEQESPIQMPYLKKLAGESMIFRNAAANVPVCSPSRASFFSGLLPTSNGSYMNGSDAWRKPGSPLLNIDSLPEHFTKQGYLTWGAGKLLHAKVAQGRELFDIQSQATSKYYGFGPFGDDNHPYILKGTNKFKNIQAWQGPDEDFPDVVNADAAIEFLQQNHDKPFLMVYGLWRPHTPYTSPKRFFDLYKDHQFSLPDSYRADDLNDVSEEARSHSDGLRDMQSNGKLDPQIWKQMLWGYAAGSSFADWNMGRVIEALDKSDYASNTIVIVTSDNGYHFGDKNRWGKGTLWENANAVPLLVRGPYIRHRETKIPVSLVDIYPTLVDYTDVALPKHKLDGHSLVPILTGKKRKIAKANFSAYVKSGTIRTERWRYIRYVDGSEELYDHKKDPHEHHNLAKDPKRRKLMDELAKHIPQQWAPSLGGRREVQRQGEEKFFKSEIKL